MWKYQCFGHDIASNYTELENVREYFRRKHGNDAWRHALRPIVGNASMHQVTDTWHQGGKTWDNSVRADAEVFLSCVVLCRPRCKSMACWRAHAYATTKHNCRVCTLPRPMHPASRASALTTTVCLVHSLATALRLQLALPVNEVYAEESKHTFSPLYPEKEYVFSSVVDANTGDVQKLGLVTDKVFKPIQMYEDTRDVWGGECCISESSPSLTLLLCTAYRAPSPPFSFHAIARFVC